MKTSLNSEPNIVSLENSYINDATSIQLSRLIRWLVFALLFAGITLVNIDHGTVPAATIELKQSLNIDDQTLGVFGSLVFFGNLIGTINIYKY